MNDPSIYLDKERKNNRITNYCVSVIYLKIMFITNKYKIPCFTLTAHIGYPNNQH